METRERILTNGNFKNRNSAEKVVRYSGSTKLIDKEPILSNFAFTFFSAILT